MQFFTFEEQFHVQLLVIYCLLSSSEKVLRLLKAPDTEPLSKLEVGMLKTQYIPKRIRDAEDTKHIKYCINGLTESISDLKISREQLRAMSDPDDSFPALLEAIRAPRPQDISNDAYHQLIHSLCNEDRVKKAIADSKVTFQSRLKNVWYLNVALVNVCWLYVKYYEHDEVCLRVEELLMHWRSEIEAEKVWHSQLLQRVRDQKEDLWIAFYAGAVPTISSKW